MYFLCPIRWNRKVIAQSIIKLKQRKKIQMKKKKRKFFDTRSISANTEFEFAATTNEEEGMVERQQQTLIRPHPSILKIDTKHSPNTPGEKTTHGGAFQNPTNGNAVKSNAEYAIDLTETTNSNHENRKSTSFSVLPTTNESASRGQLKDRRPSVVTFKLDSKKGDKKYNTIATVSQKIISPRSKL